MSGSRRTIQAVPAHTTAASGKMVPRVRGRAPSRLEVRMKPRVPSATPAMTDLMRGPGTSHIATR